MDRVREHFAGGSFLVRCPFMLARIAVTAI
jgi:hypothetical protein